MELTQKHKLRNSRKMHKREQVMLILPQNHNEKSNQNFLDMSRQDRMDNMRVTGKKGPTEKYMNRLSSWKRKGNGRKDQLTHRMEKHDCLVPTGMVHIQITTQR